MAKTLNDLPLCSALADAAKQFHTRGWMLGTAGNLSARDPINQQSFWITASGLPKGCLEACDFLNIDIQSGSIIEKNTASAKPSAETSIHQVIYSHFENAHSCMHVHSVDAALAINKHAPTGSLLRLPALEMLKGFGIWVEKPEIHLAIFDNHLEVPKIAEDIATFIKQSPPQIDALMIRNHGITVWGESIQETANRVELIEFILSYVARS